MRGVLSLLLIALWAPTLFGATGTLMPTPYQSVLDSSGNPVSGACVWTYTAGTSTPATTYSDSALTTPNSNPIVADSAGRFVAWLSTGSSYKFTFETACTAPAHGSVIRTVDNVLAVPGTSNPTTDISTVNARCTLTSGTPITTGDVGTTSATTVYVTPFRGNRIALYDGAAWNLRTVTEVGIAVPATTNTIYDVFVYDNSSTPTYETLAWTNDTTRATALTTQDGVYVKSAAVTRRYLCSFRTTGTSGQSEDSTAKRYLWNYYNRVPRPLRITEATDTWTYSTASFRQANNSTANQLDFVVGVAEVPAEAHVRAYFSSSAAAPQNVAVAIGLDSTTAAASGTVGMFTQSQVTNDLLPAAASWAGHPAVGRHVLAWLELGNFGGTATTTWYGDNGTATNFQSGIWGWVQG